MSWVEIYMERLQVVCLSVGFVIVMSYIFCRFVGGNKK